MNAGLWLTATVTGMKSYQDSHTTILTLTHMKDAVTHFYL